MKKYCRIIVILFLTFTFQFPLMGQLHLQMSSIENTKCNGWGCFYNGPSILINEVMLQPSTGNGYIYSTGSVSCGEWIELFNPDWCRSVDISCYFLGNNTPHSGTYAPGGFTLPQGTIIPPLGFCLIRGQHAPAVSSDLLVANGGNTVEIVVSSIPTCVNGWDRIWFPDAGGWFAFYNANGVVQDAIAYSSFTNFSHTIAPCIAAGSGCPFTGPLPSYSAIHPSRLTILFNEAEDAQHNLPRSNLTFRRIPDGGNWVRVFPSTPTMGACNSACINNFASTCDGMAIVNVTGGFPPYTYNWNDMQGQTTDTAIGLCSGVYTVTVTDASGAFLIDSVFVDEYSSISYDTVSICFQESYVFARQILIEAGSYVDSLQNDNGCDSIRHLELIIYPEITVELGENTIICKSDSSSLVLDAGQGDYTYEWSTGETTQTITVSETEQYSVTVTNAIGCSKTDQIKVTFVDDPLVEIENATTNFCDEFTAYLSISTNAPAILWSTGEIGNSIEVHDFGTYYVEVSEYHCSSSDTIEIEFCCPEDPMLPNIITPSDQNGINDFFEFPPELPYKEMDIYIYNRWGKLIYKSSGSKFRWDGTVNGKIENGIFYYVIYLKDNCTFHGSLTVF